MNGSTLSINKCPFLDQSDYVLALIKSKILVTGKWSSFFLIAHLCALIQLYVLVVQNHLGTDKIVI